MALALMLNQAPFELGDPEDRRFTVQVPKRPKPVVLIEPKIEPAARTTRKTAPKKPSSSSKALLEPKPSSRMLLDPKQVKRKLDEADIEDPTDPRVQQQRTLDLTDASSGQRGVVTLTLTDMDAGDRLALVHAMYSIVHFIMTKNNDPLFLQYTRASAISGLVKVRSPIVL
jgi:hypothetical protein